MVHVPAHFGVEDPMAVLVELLATHPATLVTSAHGRLRATVLPLIHEPGGGPHGTLLGHVASANRDALDGAGRPGLVTVLGPEGYVSPSWYPSKVEHGRVVPTWDYVAVEAEVTVTRFDDPARLLALVGALTDRHERDRPAPWAVEDAPADFVERLLGAIVGLELRVDALTAKAKLSQNRPAPDVAGVIEGLHAAPRRPHALAMAVARPPEGPTAPR